MIEPARRVVSVIVVGRPEVWFVPASTTWVALGLAAVAMVSAPTGAATISIPATSPADSRRLSRRPRPSLVVDAGASAGPALFPAELTVLLLAGFSAVAVMSKSLPARTLQPLCRP